LKIEKNWAKTDAVTYTVLCMIVDDASMVNGAHAPRANWIGNWGGVRNN